MRVLDLFSGLGGWSNAAREMGHDVTTLDIDPRFGADIVDDILNVRRIEGYDLVLASPPCETFSTGSIGTHWGGGLRAYEPKTDAARMALRIVTHTFALIASSRAHYVIENPRGVMRKIAPMRPDGTQWYCQWGERRAKPTDLWTDLPLEWRTCHNGNPDHDAQSRYYWKRKALGQIGGTQGMKDAAARAVIPRELALHVLERASW